MLLVTIFPLSTREQKECPDSLTWAGLPGTLGPGSLWALWSDLLGLIRLKKGTSWLAADRTACWYIDAPLIGNYRTNLCTFVWKKILVLIFLGNFAHVRCRCPGLVQFDQVLGWWRIRYSPPLGQTSSEASSWRRTMVHQEAAHHSLDTKTGWCQILMQLVQVERFWAILYSDDAYEGWLEAKALEL
jgi:hypothetical protein